MADVICPQDGRRSVSELASKLILMQVATTAAYCHLLSIRGETIRSYELLCFALCPAVLLFQVIPALAIQAAIAVFGYFLGCCISSDTRKALYKCLKRAPAIIFGRIHEDTNYGNAYSFPEPPRRHKISHRSERIIAVLLFAASSIQSIARSTARRQGLDGDGDDAPTSEIDRRVVEVSSGGLVVALSTLVYLVFEPQTTRSKIEKSAVGFPPQRLLLWLCEPPHPAAYLVLFWLAGCARRWGEIAEGFREFLSYRSWLVVDVGGGDGGGGGGGGPVQQETATDNFSLLVLYFQWVVVLGLPVCAGFLALGWDKVNEGKRPDPWKKGVLALALILSLYPVAMLLIVLVTVPFFDLLMLIEQLGGILVEIWKLTSWPEHEPCHAFLGDGGAIAF